MLWTGLPCYEGAGELQMFDVKLSYVMTCEVVGAGGMEGTCGDSIHIQRVFGCRCYDMPCEDGMQRSTCIRRVFGCRRYVGLG